MAQEPLLSDTLSAEPLLKVWDLDTGDLVALKARRGQGPAYPHSQALALSKRLGLTAPWSLIVEVPDELEAVLAEGHDSASGAFVLVITNAVLNGDPVTTLRAVRTMRERGWAIAVDTPEWGTPSLALFPLINPDLILLDLDHIDGIPLEHADEILDVIGSQAENADCSILALGIRSQHDVNRARALGATLGQGDMLDHTRPHSYGLPRVEGIRMRPPQTDAARLHDTPFTVVTERRESRSGSRRLLFEISLLLERRAGVAGSSAVVLSTFQHSRNLSGPALRRYNRLGHSALLVATFAQQLLSREARNAFTEMHIDEADLLGLEWTVIVLLPTFAAVLTAKQTGLSPDGSAAFEFVFSRNHRLAIEAARTLTARL